MGDQLDLLANAGEGRKPTTWKDVHAAARRPSPSGRKEGQRRRDRGMAKAMDHADESIKRAATEAWDRLCRSKEYVTSDDLWMTIPLDAASPDLGKVIGAIIRASAKRKQIEATGSYRKTARAAGHARAVAIWRSLTFERVQ